MSYETRYAARKNAEFNRRADSPEAAAWRVRNAAMNEEVRRLLAEKYPKGITVENAEEYVADQYNFYAELRKQDGSWGSP